METQRIRYIYEIKNLVNGKTYIGQHTLRKGRTFETDIYYGSGKLINEAQRKYGLENFEKTIVISGFFTKEQINRFERCMIACQRLCGKAEYNIADGGDGGDTSRFIDYSKVAESMSRWNQTHKDEVKDHIKKMIITRRNRGDSFKTRGTTGYKFSEEQKRKLSESRRGDKNGSFGKSWWTNGKENIKSDVCPEGFWKGRIIKSSVNS